MCGNRVDELEEQVNQLQATVDGLTDELVECKVRIRELESAVDDDTGFAPDDVDEATESTSETEPADNHNAEAAEEADEDDVENDSDIIIA